MRESRKGGGSEGSRPLLKNENLLNLQTQLSFGLLWEKFLDPRMGRKQKRFKMQRMNKNVHTCSCLISE